MYRGDELGCECEHELAEGSCEVCIYNTVYNECENMDGFPNTPRPITVSASAVWGMQDSGEYEWYDPS